MVRSACAELSTYPQGAAAGSGADRAGEADEGDGIQVASLIDIDLPPVEGKASIVTLLAVSFGFVLLLFLTSALFGRLLLARRSFRINLRAGGGDGRRSAGAST